MQIRQCSGLVMQTLSQRQCNLVTCSSCEHMDSSCLGICGLNSTSTGKIKSKLVNYSISLLTILISFDYCDRIRDLKLVCCDSNGLGLAFNKHGACFG